MLQYAKKQGRKPASQV